MDSLKRLSLGLWLSFFLLHLCGAQDTLQLVDGDVTLGAMFSVNNIQGDGPDCGDYDIDSLKEVTVAKWFVDHLNRANYIPGVRLGLDVYRTCQSRERAARNAVLMIEKYHVLREDENQDMNTTKPLIGLLGPERTQEAVVVSRLLNSLPATQQPLVISGSATGAALSDSTLHSNFFRVIPPDSTQVQVLLKLLQELRWSYIAIVYNNDDYGKQAAKELKDLATGVNLCVPVFRSLPLDYRSQEFISAADAIIDRLRGGDSSIVTGVVFIGTSATAKEFVQRLSQRVTFVRFIFSEGVGVASSVVAGTTVGKGALAAAPPFPALPEFQIFWNTMWTDRSSFLAEVQKNTWLGEYYKAVTSCGISDSNCFQNNQQNLPLIQDNTQWFFEYYQVKATAIFASVLKRFHSAKCGSSWNGVCLQLQHLIGSERDKIIEAVQNGVFDLEDEFKNITSIFRTQTNVRFNSQGEIITDGDSKSVYNVFNYRQCSASPFCFQEVANYTAAGELQLDTDTLKGYSDSGSVLNWPFFPKSQCKEGYDCLECLSSDIAAEIIFVPGDFYVVAVVPVHGRAANSPLTCGAIRQTDGADITQSVLFAVQQINEKRTPFLNIFGTKSLGVVILNSCFRELVIQEKLVDFNKGNLVLPDGRNSSDILPYVAGYVGAFFSTVSVAMYEVLTALDMRFVMLSPANTSPELSDRKKYPLYLRLTNGQNSEGRAILSLVQSLGHKYVQLLYDPDDVYSLAMKEGINALSSTQAFNVCVVNNIASSFADQSFYWILDELRKSAWAPLVIVTLQENHIKNMLKDILPQMTSADRFRYIGSDGWARAKSLLDVPNKEKLLGSISFSVELPLNQLFNEEIRNMDPLNTVNPWMKYFWEAKEQCFFDGSFQKKDKIGPCPRNVASDYIQSTWVPFYINAIYTFALGLNSAMSTRCRQAYLCEALTSQNLADALKAVRFDLHNSGVKVNVFDNNSDGDVGYKLYQVAFDLSTVVGDDLTYEQVGRYDHESLTLVRQDMWLLSNLQGSQCPNDDACRVCLQPAKTGLQSGNETDTLNNDSNDGALIATGIIIAILLIAIIVLVVFLVLMIRRLKARQANDRVKIALDNLPASSPSGQRPLPPIGQRSNSAFSGDETNSGSRNTDIVANEYDYLHSYHSNAGNTAAPSRHSYMLATAPIDPSRVSRSSSHQPPSSLNSSGYVTRDSGNCLPLDLSSSSSGERNSSQVGKESVSSGNTHPPPLVFENEVPREEAPAPPPCDPATDADYMTPVSDYLSPTV